ncbi:MAG: DUF177 domain-containing protein [Blastocatellales bacterium]
MIISLSRMPADGLVFKHQYEADELDTSEREFELQAPPLVNGRVNRAGMDMRVQGEIRATMIATCDRCLADIPLELQIPFDLIYVPEGFGTSQSSETELHNRDLDLAVYENDQINLDDLVLEQLELSLPSRILCREDCRGLCSQCGADLNLEQCRCEKPIDPRWQALAYLKNKSEEE